MIRMRVKNILLSIMILTASCVFFACKEPAKIKVENIAFAEQSISLLVGDEYTPEIKVLPSYATTRSYYLISNDTTALKVDGGTITALKPALGVKLKVVSEENANINDVISVDIYGEAIELDAPTELKFDGSRFTFVGKDNASAYMLKVNGTEVAIGNNTEYSFADIVSKIDNLYNQVITCEVKSVGDGKIFKDSAYCEAISFVKLASVNNAYVENEVLYFDSIKDVASYNVSVLNENYTQTVNNPSFDEKQLSLDMSALSAVSDGAEYVIEIIPNVEGYNASSEVGVFAEDVSTLNYAVLGKVKNLSIVEKVMSWGFVKNAQTYTIQTYKDGELLDEFSNIVNNELKLDYEEGGNYSFKVIANATGINITTGKEYSTPLEFEILHAPEISADNNSITWTDVNGAEGYLVTIQDELGEFIANQKFVIDNSYDVSSFIAGTYSIEVVACGNGENGNEIKAIISSKVSTQINWTILNDLQYEVKDEKLLWKDLDINSLNKYRVTFDNVDVVLTSQDYGTQYSYDQATNTYSYDLSGYDFAPNKYVVTVQSVGDGATFDADVNEIEIIKLAESTILGLANKQFTISPVANASSYKIEIYKSSALDESVLTLDKMNGHKFSIDSSVIEAGNYVAKVFVFGNGTTIFDAEEATTDLPFEKLATPTIDIDKTNFKVIVDKDDLVKNESVYKLFENSIELNGAFVDNQYELSNLVEGDYTYTAQAIGDRFTVLDSDITTVESAKNVKKLSTPTIKFVKDELKFEVSCGSDEQFVSHYTFTLGDKPIAVANNVVHCSAEDDVNIAGNYEAKVYANPLESAEYDLIMASGTKSYQFSKLDGLCDFTISNGMLIVTPDIALAGDGYRLSLCIDNGENDIILEDFDYSSSQFSIRLQDLEYNVIDAISSLMQGAGEYSVYTTISQNEESVVTSTQTKCVNTLKVLGKVVNIAKNAQTIEFDSIDSVANYFAVVVVEENEYYIDLAQTENVLTIEKLLTLMEDVGVPYLEQQTYDISFVAESDDERTLANKGVDKYSFEFLKTPVISMIEQENNSKHLSIINGDFKASKYYITISQGETVIELAELKSADENTIIDINEVTKDAVTMLPRLVAGDVKVEVKSSASSGEYFDSKNYELNIIKLDSPAITVVNGLLNWAQADNAKQYNLTYSNLSGTKTIVLMEGSENFIIEQGKCIYDFSDFIDDNDDLIAGNTSLYLQVDANLQQEDTYYLNSNTGEMFDVYKMENPLISVVNGEIYIEVKYADLATAEKVELKVDDVSGIELSYDGENITVLSNGVNLVELKDGSVKYSFGMDKLCITLDPKVLCKYGETELLKETLTIKAYSKHETTLNSSTATKEVYGLLNPVNLNIATSITENENKVIDEVIEKIIWGNPSANASYVANYEIVITYRGVDYSFNSSTLAFMMPTYCEYDANGNDMLDYNEDANGNSVLDEGEDINGNGILDRVEVVFGSGEYTIKVRALTNNNEQYLHSNYGSEIKVTVLDTPNSLSVQKGNISWNNNASAGYYILKVYLLGKDENGETKELLVSTQSNVSEFDLTKVALHKTGIYGITVQAMHDASKILASKESDMLQVIRLPEITEYYVKDGELYFRVHKFASRIDINLIDKETGYIVNKVPSIYTGPEDGMIGVLKYSTNGGYRKWTDSDIIDTYTDEDYFIDVKYEVDGDSTIPGILEEDYRISVNLVGNSYTSTDLSSFNLGGVITGLVSQPVNRYLQNINAEDKNVVEKLITPVVEVSNSERGTVLLSIPDELKYNLNYYMNDGKSLQGVHLYEVNIATDKPHTLYIAEIVNNDLFQASLSAVGSQLIQEGQDKNYLKHFEYNGMTFNVIDSTDGYVSFNFNNPYYYYYEPINVETGLAGGYCNIDLTKGGLFVVNVRFMGDDTIYVNSNVTKDVSIKRYSVLNVTIDNGVISWINQATLDDHPIYLITLSGDNENYNLVLYNPNAEYEEGKKYTEEYLLSCLDNSKTYIFDTITYVVSEETKDEIITYQGLADIVDKARMQDGGNIALGKIGLGGIFTATIKAHYTDVSSTDVILAQGAESKSVTILPQSQISVNKGNLIWNMSHVSNTGGQSDIKNYLLQVFNGEDKLYEITLTSSMYNVSSGVAEYQLPQILNNGNDGDFTFTAGSNYTFKLIALGGDSSTYINSVATTTGEINLLPQLENVKMENGVLTWTNTTTNAVEIQISYNIGDTTIVFTTTESSNLFKLPTSFDDVNGTTRYLVEGNNYYIRARLKGGTTALNGFYNDEFGGVIKDEYKIITTRLATIDSNSIVTSSGVLTWEANELEGVTYTVVYTLEDGTTYTTDMLDTNAFNFEGIASGVINVKVLAHHNNHFTSFASNTNAQGEIVASKMVEIFKLSTVSIDSIKYHVGSDMISWDKVVDRDGNYIENYRVSITQEGAETREYDCSKTDTTESNVWIVTGVVGTSFSIAVKAISVESNGKTINSDYTGYSSMELPNQVDVATFVFDEAEQAFTWKAIVGEQESDTYYIGYNYYTTKPTEGNAIAPTEIAELEVVKHKEINGEKYYYYYPSKMGSYRLIYVQVKRAGSLSSQPTYCMADEQTEYALDFNLFASGYGTEDNPYKITDEKHLRNIKYFLDANYELDNDIKLESSEFITNASQIFTGTINGLASTGDRHKIEGATTSSSTKFDSSGYYGLFARVQGATFSNIILTGFNVQGIVDSQKSYIGILVGKVEMSTDESPVKTIFQNIDVTSSTIQITKNTREGYTSNNSSIYVGALAGYAEFAKFENCQVILSNTEEANIIATLEGNAQTIFAIGALAGYADNCEFTNNIIDTNNNAYILSTKLTTASGSAKSPVVYAGALIGEEGAFGVTMTGTNSYTAQRVWSSYTEQISMIGKEN